MLLVQLQQKEHAGLLDERVPQVETDLEMCFKQEVSPVVEKAIKAGHLRRHKEVEEAVPPKLARHQLAVPHPVPLSQGHVLSGLPMDLATFAAKCEKPTGRGDRQLECLPHPPRSCLPYDLRTLEHERTVRIGRNPQTVGLGQHLIGEKRVLGKLKLNLKAILLAGTPNPDILQVGEQWNVVELDKVLQ